MCRSSASEKKAPNCLHHHVSTPSWLRAHISLTDFWQLLNKVYTRTTLQHCLLSSSWQIKNKLMSASLYHAAPAEKKNQEKISNVPRRPQVISIHYRCERARVEIPSSVNIMHHKLLQRTAPMEKQFRLCIVSFGCATLQGKQGYIRLEMQNIRVEENARKKKWIIKDAPDWNDE